ncbi:hypothetical protein FQA39_LY07561 [Lamprigera yunnana]|nr:hypothetical protein FQA39_LY07561 [Lamprigera yunnana]
MIDDEPSDNEGEAHSRDDKDYVPSADDIEDKHNVEIEELEDDLLLEADSDECDDDTNHVGIDVFNVDPFDNETKQFVK